MAISLSLGIQIVKHVRKVYTMRFANGILDSVLVKYCATMTAY